MGPRPATAAVLLALAALAAGGCFGGGDDGGDRAARATPGPAASGSVPEPSAKPEAGAEEVIRAWADTLRRGDVSGAAAYFALPSTVANGTAPLKLRTRREVEVFNRALPCGAEVIATEDAPHGFVIATFRLVERPGAGRCGSGTGATARTALLVRDGHITDWLRVPDGDVPDAEGERS